MLKEELMNLWNLSYKECLQELKDKYGPVTGSYFLTESCKTPNKKIKRSSEGLYVHHDYEYDPDDDRVNNLSHSEIAIMYPWKYQQAENLTYCNWLEHLILHLKINLLRKEQLGFYVLDGVENFFIPQLNTFYAYENDIGTTPEYLLVAFSLIEENYDEYCWLIDTWFSLVGYPEHLWRNRRI